ncbi:MAG: cysteine synthase A [Candidatus Micrarchaeota archaeon]
MVGNTPMVEIYGILAKLETTNPTGSIKDRMVWHMIRNAELKGELQPGMEIIEATSGNTGIALASIAASRGYKFTAVMPEFVSRERVQMMERFGANVILTPASEDMAGTIRRYEELVKEKPDAYLPKQFQNPDNYEAHEIGTGREIIEQTGGKLEAFVSAIGTGGTIIGIAKALNKLGRKVRIVGVEPEESAVLNGGKPGRHKIQGIGEGFVPDLVREHRELIDEIIPISSEEAIKMSEKIAKEYGLLVGISSGANVLAALKVKNEQDLEKVVTILPDRGERYLMGESEH